MLADFIDRVEYHSVGDYPAKVIFFADGQVYEIVHAAQGKETLLARVLADASEEPSCYLVLVDEPEQIELGFLCDLGVNIQVGDGFLTNYNVTILDMAPVRIGHNVWLGPNVGLCRGASDGSGRQGTAIRHRQTDNHRRQRLDRWELGRADGRDHRA